MNVVLLIAVVFVAAAAIVVAAASEVAGVTVIAAPRTSLILCQSWMTLRMTFQFLKLLHNFVL